MLFNSSPNNCKTRQETFKFWDLVRLILENLRYTLFMVGSRDKPPAKSIWIMARCLSSICSVCFVWTKRSPGVTKSYWITHTFRALSGFGVFRYPISWWRHQMEKVSALLALCAGNSPVTGEFPSQRPVTRSFDVFFDLCLNKRLSKQSWGWWSETPSSSLWRHCNVDSCYSRFHHLLPLGAILNIHCTETYCVLKRTYSFYTFYSNIVLISLFICLVEDPYTNTNKLKLGHGYVFRRDIIINQYPNLNCGLTKPGEIRHGWVIVSQF